MPSSVSSLNQTFKTFVYPDDAQDASKGRIINILPLGLSDKESESGNDLKKKVNIIRQRKWKSDKESESLYISDKESESGNYLIKKVDVEIKSLQCTVRKKSEP